MKKDLNPLLDKFSTISLTEMSSTASFMERIETKYILDLATLDKLLDDFLEDYYIFEIDDEKVLSYSNVYMDTKDLKFFHDHNDGEKYRMKTRSRKYESTKDTFFEVKCRQDQIMRKFRYLRNKDHFTEVTSDARKFFDGIYQSLFSFKLGEISATLKTHYSRITFCSKSNDERITIDLGINFSGIGENAIEKTLINTVIVEIKTVHKETKGHKIMEKHGIKKADNCSKYCLGLIYTGIISGKTRFDETKNLIDTIEKNILGK